MSKRRIIQATSIVALAALQIPALGARGLLQDGKSKTPPAGAPWVQSFPEARAQALLHGKPIFLYSTKTY